MSALMDGTCDDFISAGYTLRYWIARAMGNSLCEDMMWYKTITLTRYLVAEPLKFLYVSVGVIPGEQCQLDMVWDMCAGVIGSMSWLDFMIEKGLWIMVGLIVTAPMLKYFFDIICNGMHLAFGEIHFLLYKSQARFRKRKKKFLSFVHRCRLFMHHASSKTISPASLTQLH